MCIVNKNVFVVLLGELKVVEYDELSEVLFRDKGMVIDVYIED